MVDGCLRQRHHLDLLHECEPREGQRVERTLAAVLGFRGDERSVEHNSWNRGTARAFQVGTRRVASVRWMCTCSTRLAARVFAKPPLSPLETKERTIRTAQPSVVLLAEGLGKTTKGRTPNGSDELSDGLIRRVQRTRTCRNTSVGGRWRAKWTPPSASHGRISRIARNLGAEKEKGKDVGSPRVEETRGKREGERWCWTWWRRKDTSTSGV